MALTSPAQERSLLLGFALALALAAAATLFSLWIPIVLAIWTATLGRPLVARLTPRLGGKQRAASVAVLLLLVGVLAPLTLVTVSLTGQAIALVKRLSTSESARNALANIVSGGAGAGPGGLPSGEDILSFLRAHGMQAFGVVQSVAGATANLVIGVFLFVLGVFALLTEGSSFYVWFVRHSPFPERATRRLSDAFMETGRGLLVGVGLTGLAQGVVATIAYIVLGVPTAFVLGFLTCIVSLIPSVGTAMVWVPVAGGLWLTGRPVAAAIMAGVGLVVISSIDNLLRPVFVRMGELKLSTFTLFASMFGGIASFGAQGLILGPLLLRLAKEALAAAREEADPYGERDPALPSSVSVPPPPPRSAPRPH